MYNHWLIMFYLLFYIYIFSRALTKYLNTNPIYLSGFEECGYIYPFMSVWVLREIHPESKLSRRSTLGSMGSFRAHVGTHSRNLCIVQEYTAHLYHNWRISDTIPIHPYTLAILESIIYGENLSRRASTLVGYPTTFQSLCVYHCHTRLMGPTLVSQLYWSLLHYKHRSSLKC